MAYCMATPFCICRNGFVLCLKKRNTFNPLKHAYNLKQLSADSGLIPQENRALIIIVHAVLKTAKVVQSKKNLGVKV